MIKMSEVLKVSYRGIGGLISLSLLFAFGFTSLMLFIVGALCLTMAVIVILNPSVLGDVTFISFGAKVVDPTAAFIILILAGFLLILLGGMFLALTTYLSKAVFALDKEIAVYVDRNVPSTGKVIDKLKNHPNDKISKLERLTILKEKNVLTEAEFLQEKQLILKEKA